MIAYTFPYYISYGKMDSVDCEIDVELSDEENERLIASAHAEGRFHLSEDDDISDMYDKVFALAVEQEIDSLRSDEDYMCEQVGDALDLDEDEAEEHEFTDEELEDYLTSYSTMDVNYPEELQFLE